MPKIWCFFKKDEKLSEGQKKEKAMIKQHQWLRELDPRPSALWIQKTMTLFSRFDRDGNGFVNDQDIESFAESFKKHGSLSKERASRMRDKIYAFWKLLNKGAKQVTLEEFIKERIPLVQNPEFGAEIWEQYLKHVGTLMYCSIDANEDGTISLQEFVLFFKCINVKEEHAREIFANLDVDGDRQMSKTEFIDAFHDFLYSEEDSPSKELFGPLMPFDFNK